MRVFLLTLIALALTACSKPYDKYIGYWKLENSTSPRILSIYKEDKETYLVNDNILAEKDFFGNKKTGTVLEKKEKELGVNNGLTVIPFNLSEDGKTLRIGDRMYTKISEEEVKTTLKNKEDCTNLRAKYQEESKAFNLFAKGAEKEKQDQVKEKYIDLQKQIPDCKFYIANAY
ncbi:hypothetical protein [Acinetobacter baumannii]|uniref:hypothetical protein n=1 Tax=Acinetobacter baumannii TaxID=470 RepID=UPI00105828BB|nr:hypothetical protein [Acinetobacter baumannii]MDC5235431.1 hypothetical protein [Acinetobacter baumannii]QBM32308.1 hypothetical protein E1A89_01360 [Acinetobacter baumannii]QBM42764.1 hypothetical protein E1A87_00740 [Acinetobacter baumannii]